MKQPDANKLTRESLDLLMKEYDHLTQSYLDEKRKGVTRFNLFLTIISALVALVGWKGIVVPSANLDITTVEKQLLLLILCLFLGAFTLVRLIRRDLTSDLYLSGLAKIRSYFAQHDPLLEKFLAFDPESNPPKRERKWKSYWNVEFSGLVEMVSMINSFLFGGFVAFSFSMIDFQMDWNFRDHLMNAFVVDSIVFGLSAAFAWFIQFLYVRWRFSDNGS